MAEPARQEPPPRPQRIRNVRMELMEQLYAKQRAAIFEPKRYSLIEASTKAGKTSGCIVWSIHQALQARRGQNIWWVAPVTEQALIAFRRTLATLREQRRTLIVRRQPATITVATGATIWFKSADKPDSLYGEDVYAAIIDEASRVKEEAWHAIRSTLTFTRGPIRIIGNVKGRQNWFYRMARQAEQGSPDMAFHRMIAHDAIEAGVLDEAEIEDARRNLPEAVFNELYLAIPSDDQGNPFGLASIRACVVPAIAHGPPAYWGIDLAKKQDWTAIIGLNREGNVCQFHRWQKPWMETIGLIEQMVKHTPALIDATGVGDPIVEQLQRKCTKVEGYVFSASSKQRLMEGLALAIGRRAVTFPDGDIVRELETFEYEYTRTGVRYTAPEGLFDDCVSALALAIQCKASAPRAFHANPVTLQNLRKMSYRRRWG